MDRSGGERNVEGGGALRPNSFFVFSRTYLLLILPSLLSSKYILSRANFLDEFVRIPPTSCLWLQEQALRNHIMKALHIIVLRDESAAFSLNLVSGFSHYADWDRRAAFV